MAFSLSSFTSVLAADTFIAPEYSDPNCEVAWNIDGTQIPFALPPDMIAEVVGIPVATSGTPAAQTLVVAELGGSVDQAVVRTFLQNCGLDPATWTDVLQPGSSNPPLSGEATLDLTVVAGILPANTTLKTATIQSSINLGDALLNAANACGLDGSDPSRWQRSQLDTPTGGCIVTMSYSVFEKSLRSILNDDFNLTTPQEQDEYISDTNEVLASMSDSGVITIISSGDEGSGGCQPLTRGIRNEMAPQWPSTSPYALSVGGTMWAPSNWSGAAITPTAYVPGASYQPVTWRNWDLGSDCLWEVDTDPDNNVAWPGIGTTSGESEFSSRPGYQDRIAAALPGSTGRLSPDISTLAGWPTWLVPENNDATALSFSMGTSAAAPLVAVGLAHVNAALTAQGLSPLDNSGGSMDVHNVLYNTNFSGAINDVTQGTNNLWSSDLWLDETAVTTESFLEGLGFLNDGVPTANNATDIDGYSAGVGYDMATGLGVVNFSTLAALLIEAQTVSFDPQGPPPVLQQLPIPASGSCADIDDSEYNWGGAGTGGWAKSWAQWGNAGAGGAICTRTLIYNPSFGIWVIER